MKNISNNKLTIIVPTYNADNFLNENLMEWKKTASYFKVILVEDGTKESEETAKKIGAEYYWKENGNWGSVINYSKELDIETEYVMVVDADDFIDPEILLKILSQSNSNDILMTGVDDIDYKTKIFKTRYSSLTNPSNTFIHTIIFKTELFKSIHLVPEGIPHQDHHVVFDIFKLGNSKKVFNLSPYKYFYNIPGQTISKKPKNYGEIVSTYSNIKGDDTTTKYIEAFTNASIIFNTRNKELKKEMLKKYRKNRANKYMPYFWVLIMSLFKK